MAKYRLEVYHVNEVYLEGWYTIEELKTIVETAERIDQVNRQIAEELDFTDDRTSG